MRRFKNMLLMALVGVLVACGGGSGESGNSPSGESGNSPISPLLPPGATGMSTLVGVDSNANGLRDDVELVIQDMYEDNPEDMQILNMGVRAIQMQLESTMTGTDQDSDAASEMTAMFIYCLMEHSSMDEDKGLTLLTSLMINTEARRQAYDSYDASRDGTIQRVVSVSRDECKN